MEITPILRREQHVSRPGRPRLFQRSWRAEEASRTLLVVHGFGEHSGCYEPLARWFARRECVVFAFDQRGHGRSGGTRAHARRFGDYLDDLAEVMEGARAECPEAPLYLVGHGLGALVGTHFLQAGEPGVAGALLSGIPLPRHDAASALRASGAALLATFAPRWRLPAGLEGETAEAAPADVSGLREDPELQHTHITASLRAQILRATGRVHASTLRHPVLLLQGERGTRCDPATTQHFVREAPHARLLRYPQLPHAIFQTRNPEGIFADMLAWLRETEETPA